MRIRNLILKGSRTMEDYVLIARQEKQIEALKTEVDHLKKVKSPTQIENATLQQRNDALELENNSLKSEIQVMTAIQEMNETQKMPIFEHGAEHTLIAGQEKQIEALKTEVDYLKKVKSPTQIENATLQQRNDALELENNSLKSEIQVMTEKYETVKLDTESAQLQKLELTRKHNREKKGMLLSMAWVFVAVVSFASIVTYNFGHRNGVSNARNDPNFEVGQVMSYLIVHHKSDDSIRPYTVSRATGIPYDNVLSILLTLERRGILTKSQVKGVDTPPVFQLKP